MNLEEILTASLVATVKQQVMEDAAEELFKCVIADYNVYLTGDDWIQRLLEDVKVTSKAKRRQMIQHHVQSLRSTAENLQENSINCTPEESDAVKLVRSIFQ